MQHKVYDTTPGSPMKTTIFTLICSLLILAASNINAAAPHKFQSDYVGQEKRQIKTLSKTDIYDLQNGNGWGLAKAAELNGVPGPKHLLEMQGEISLNAEQIRRIQEIFSGTYRNPARNESAKSCIILNL